MPTTCKSLYFHSIGFCYLIVRVSRAPFSSSWEATLMPSRLTVCWLWLPFSMTSSGEIGCPSLYISHEAGSATWVSGLKCTHIACMAKICLQIQRGRGSRGQVWCKRAKMWRD